MATKEKVPPPPATEFYWRATHTLWVRVSARRGVILHGLGEQVRKIKRVAGQDSRELLK
jgi:hypothetical protein